ncbi:MAG: hypothetical protein R2757_21965 [Draconibacterium sp.]
MDNPDDGLEVAGFTFHMPTATKCLFPKMEYADISDILDHQVDIDPMAELEINLFSEDDTIAEEIARAL